MASKVVVKNINNTGWKVTYVGPTPRGAVICAHAQMDLNDYQTWNYQERYGHLPVADANFVQCGDWYAQVNRARCVACVATFGRDLATPADIRVMGILGDWINICWEHACKRTIIDPITAQLNDLYSGQAIYYYGE